MGVWQTEMTALQQAIDFPWVGDPEFRQEFFNHSRQSSAYFVFQEGVECFQGRHGRVHFARQSTPFGPINFVMTDPLCAAQDMAELLEEFDRAQSCPNIYVAVTQVVADAVAKRGYSVNQVGVENSFRLDTFSLRGKKKKQLRHASHFGERTGCVVRELPWSDVDAQQVENISLDWIHSKVISNREIRYSTRPAVFGDEWLVRKFYCMHEGRVVAYVFFDPYFESGKLKGYCANILRGRQEKCWNGALDFTVLEAVHKFREEGVPRVSLGVSPFHNIQPVTHEKKIVRWISQWFYEHGNRFYAFKNLAYHKTRYRADETPWFLCMKDVSLLRAYWGLLFGLKALGKQEL
ncbi:MAG: hypothetical protein C9356_17300 [Oleiphilus sp.]|nr:MAG: hypothetical protein C9356_17300 [Oleiphilus sp.]